MNKEKTCPYKMYDDEQCGRELYDEEHCIFHSKDVEGKKKEFNEKIQDEINKILEMNVHDFTGFIFPDSISFKRIELKKNTYFSGAQFKGKRTSFNGAQFKGKRTSFNSAQFTGQETSFEWAQFTGKKTSFDKTKFKGKWTSFIRTQFKGRRTSFEWAQFTGKKTSFDKTKFKGKRVDFHNCFFDNIFYLFDALRNNFLKRLLLKGKYKSNDFRFHLGEKSAKAYPVIDRLKKDAWYLDDFKEQNKLAYWVWFFLADCGRSFFRWIFLSAIFAFSFACKFIYSYAANPNSFIFKDQPESIITFFYYSVVTFTTLGFGDVVPATESLKVWVMAEVILGYIMLGGLISIFANKLARRS